MFYQTVNTYNRILKFKKSCFSKFLTDRLSFINEKQNFN